MIPPNEVGPREFPPEGPDTINASHRQATGSPHSNAAGRQDRGGAAIEYARHGWPVFPLRGKVPAISKDDGGRGVLDATTDPLIVAAWWTGRYAGCNIGGRVPESMIVLDVDPRHGGDRAAAHLQERHGRLPETLTTISGRGDGGVHYFYRRPSGQLSAKRLGPGIDLKTSTGYVVLPPSIHLDSGRPYTQIERPVAAPPAWLIELLRPEPPKITTPKCRNVRHFSGPSIADQFSANTSWADILEPHRWTCDGDPDVDGAVWLHPTATSSCSATVRNGCLFVYSTNTVFDVTESGDPHGYTKFSAFALLDHGGNMSAAARALRGVA